MLQMWAEKEENGDQAVRSLYSAGIGWGTSSSYGVDVGQALSLRKHQGQRWMEGKVA